MTKNEKKMPKGGRKGGSIFPRVPLKKAIEYSRKLVSKTHTGPQPSQIIMPGVFNNSRMNGEAMTKVSALKQFDLLVSEKDLYNATDFSKKIFGTPDEEVMPLLIEACLKPKIFRTLYQAFSGDTVTRGKLKQQALAQNVHPDTSDEFVNVFTASLEYAGLVTKVDDDYSFIAIDQIASEEASETENSVEVETEATSAETDDNPLSDRSSEHTKKERSRNTVATVQISINLDSTMDTDKLERQLKLLKQYGAI